MKNFSPAVPIIIKSYFEAEISQILTEDKMAPKNLSEVLLTVTQYWLNILTRFVCFTLEITRELYMVLSIANSAIIAAIDNCFNTGDTNNVEMLGPFVLSQFGQSREVHSSNLKCHSYPPALEVYTLTSHQWALSLSSGVSTCDGLWKTVTSIPQSFYNGLRVSLTSKTVTFMLEELINPKGQWLRTAR